ncbi:MAG: TULIP family P47-like protein [Lachnospiraceae bacterium]|nr:TULIP family P47-like protein [Lachnospiraceae bacterium]
MNQSDKVLISGMNQPVSMDFPNMNFSLAETIKNSSLYKNAANVRPDIVEEEKLQLVGTVTTNGWDTVSICRVTALNERIKKEKTYPASISEQADQLSVKGEFAPWQVVTGGDGRNVKLKVPMKNGTYTGLNFGKGTTFDLTDVSVDIYVKLSYFPMPDPKEAKDGSYELFVNTDGSEGSSDPIAAVVSLNDPANRIDSTNKSILRGLFETWLNHPENLQKFNTLFSTVLINNMGKESEEYKWLRATAISYAYTDKNTEDSSIFGILCMTNNRSCDGLPNQLPAVSLERDDNALFLISREIFVKYQLLPALPYIFKESPQAEYIVDGAGTTINANNLKLDPVRVGAIDYKPVAETFEITFEETYIRTTAQIHTPISPGIDAHTTIITKQTLALGTNSDGEQVMVYEMIGDPIVENKTDVATWIIVTEAVLALIAAVVAGVVGAVAGKIAALIVGIVVAVVVALVSIVIHVIIEKVIAEGATDALPSIAPMVKVAANQVKWPFCEPDAFVLTDIDYSGAIIFEGNLQLAEGYSIVNNRLVSDVSPA